MRRALRQPPPSQNTDLDLLATTPPPPEGVRVAQRIALKSGKQTWLLVNTSLSGPQIVEPQSDSLWPRGISSTKSVADAERNVPFDLLIAKLGSTLYRLDRGVVFANISDPAGPLTPSAVSAKL